VTVEIPRTPPEAARDHLTPTARAALGRSAEERIHLIRSGSWIPYPRAQQIRERLRWVFDQPPSQRMTGLTLSGPTNNGKTTIIRAFMAEMNGHVTAADAERRDYLYIETPPFPSASMLFTAILTAAGDLKAQKGTMTQKMFRVQHILPQIGLRMLFLDEIHNVLAGSQKQTEVFLNTLKSLSNHLRLPVVLIGTENAVHVLRTDAQVLNRFPTVELPYWPSDASFHQLVRAVLSTFPLQRPPRLTAAALQRLHKVSGGALGGVVQVLQRAAALAIKDGSEELTPKFLEAAEV